MAKKFAIPAALAACADLMYNTKKDRLAKQKECDELERQEKLLREHLINKLPKGKASGIAGKVARASIYTDPVPVIQDKKKFYKHLQKTGEFDLLQQRLSNDAVKQRWEANKVVPGVGRFNVVKVSLEKVS